VAQTEAAILVFAGIIRSLPFLRSGWKPAVNTSESGQCFQAHPFDAGMDFPEFEI
jgi:hypothetical protein